MSKQESLKTNTLEKYQSYIESLYLPGSSMGRKEFIEKTEWKDFVPVIEDDAARMLKILLEIKRPMKILEIGTSIGFSAFSMATVVKKYGGTITTVDFDEKAAKQAKINFSRLGVDDVITQLHGDAMRIVPQFADSSFDFIFQDVDNRLYAPLFNDCVRILKPGGIFIADDTLFPAMALEENTEALREPTDEFNRLVVAEPQLESTLLPIGDGVTVAVKK